MKFILGDRIEKPEPPKYQYCIKVEFMHGDGDKYESKVFMSKYLNIAMFKYQAFTLFKGYDLTVFDDYEFGVADESIAEEFRKIVVEHLNDSEIPKEEHFINLIDKVPYDVTCETEKASICNVVATYFDEDGDEYTVTCEETVSKKEIR